MNFYKIWEGEINIREKAAIPLYQQIFDLKLIAWNMRGTFNMGNRLNIINILQLLNFI